MSSTSLLGADLAVAGMLLQVGSAGSPETMVTIANVTDFSMPVMADTIDVTNVGDTWKRKVPTLLDMGKISFKIFWIPEEATHRNSAGGGSVPAGMRYMLINRLKADWQVVYADSNGSTDAFPAYVTEFALTGKTGNAWEASVTLSNSGAPSLV